eukprot:1156672-Pelagomonas_calceolata.AAC.1
MKKEQCACNFESVKDCSRSVYVRACACVRAVLAPVRTRFLSKNRAQGCERPRCVRSYLRLSRTCSSSSILAWPCSANGDATGLRRLSTCRQLHAHEMFYRAKETIYFYFQGLTRSTELQLRIIVMKLCRQKILVGFVLREDYKKDYPLCWKAECGSARMDACLSGFILCFDRFHIRMSAFFVSPLEKGSSKAPIRRGPYSLRRPAGFLRKVTYIILTGTLHAWGARGFLEAPGSRTTNWLCEASSFSIAHPVVGHKLVGGLDTSSPNLTHNDAKTLLVLTSFLTISSGGDSLLSRHRPRQLSSIAPDGGGIQSDMGPSREESFLLDFTPVVRYSSASAQVVPNLSSTHHVQSFDIFALINRSNNKLYP